MLIYIDSSVLLASVLREPRAPPPELWEQDLASSRLLEYEVWNWLNAYSLAPSHGDLARTRLDRVALTGLTAAALARALEPFPVAVRTLDALHLATMDFIRRQGELVMLASYDARLLDAAALLGFTPTVL